jgi:UPF0271 protein
MAAIDLRLAKAMAEGVARVDPQLILVGLAGSCLLQAAKEAGLAAASEVFADRAYNPDGTLVSRRLPGAVIDDPAVVAARVLRMVRQGTVETADGQIMRVVADTVCIHGDTPGAAGLARAIREQLALAGVGVRAMDAAALRG